jgi:hypothetical protein
VTTSELVMTSTLDILPSILCDEDNARLGTEAPAWCMQYVNTVCLTSYAVITMQYMGVQPSRALSSSHKMEGRISRVEVITSSLVVTLIYDVRHTVFTYCMHHAGASVDLPGKLLRTLATSYASSSRRPH